MAITLKTKSSTAKPIKKICRSANSTDDGLPQAPTKEIVDPLSLRWLAVAPPGWGKTEFFMAFPDSVLLACEEGHSFTEGYKIIIDCFDYKGNDLEPHTDQNGNLHMSFLQAVEKLERSNRFKFVIVDTVDAMVKQIIDFTTEAKRVEHIQDIGEYGRGYDIGQNSPFRKAINRILKTGRGIGFITHQQVNQASFSKGLKAKKETSLPGGISRQIFAQVDLVIHGVIGKRRKPNRFRDRIVVTEGTEEILAKNRGGILPTRFILPMEGRWDCVSAFFTQPSSIKKAEEAYAKHYNDLE